MKPDEMATDNTLKNEVSGESERISNQKEFQRRHTGSNHSKSFQFISFDN
jgi:hypothetical protein